MEDRFIIELYWQRSETAIAETDAKYGGFCRRIAQNILSVREDAEECVSDTYLRAWNAIPPERPAALRAWLGRIIRNLSLDRFRKNRAKRRFDGMELLLSELEDCIPDAANVEDAISARELSEVIDRWLSTLSKADRALFLRRYWNGEPLMALASELGMNRNQAAQKMLRLRQSLKAALTKEGISL